MDFQSPDDIEAEKVHRRPHKSTSSKAQRSLAFDSKISERPTNSTIKSYFQPVPRFQKLQTIQNISKPTIIDHITSPIDPITTDRDLDLLSSLTQFDDDCSDATRINNNDIDSDDYELVADQTVRNSAYMSEKKPKKTTYNESRTQRKDKGKPRFTAYMLWSKEIRQEMFRSNTDMSFSQVSRRLSQMWANVPNNERHIWRRRAKRVTMKIKKSLKTGDNLTRNYLNKMGSKKPGRSPKSSISPPHSAKASKKLSKVGRSRKNRTNDIKRTQAAYKGHPNKRRINSGAMKHSNTAIKHIKLTLPGTSVIDTAAHLKLLGDSLTIIGQRLKEHEVGLLIIFIDFDFLMQTITFHSPTGSNCSVR